MNTESNPALEGVAIIGMSGRFPGAPTLDDYWRNLRDGVESLRPFTTEELDAAAVPAALRRSPNWVNAGGPLEGIDLFDEEFFSYSPREAETIDPQQRVFLECAWHALEDAGYNPLLCDRSIGIWAGCANSSYVYRIQNAPQFAALVGGYQIALGNDRDHLCSRVAFKLNLHGPAMNVQTACSTSLVSVCCAWQALLDQQCDMALAGGVCIRIPQGCGYLWEPEGIFSPDGHCRVFDADARGTLTGNGVGVVVLKRLSDAVADHDHIYAVIRGAAVNNDGCDKATYTAPSINGQSEVIALAQALAGIDPATISYVEAHGTGTALGDPIEIAALTQAFRLRTNKAGYCAVGSVKSNIGHLDPAAGIAALIKTALAIKHGELPPSLHFHCPNPHIAFAGSPFYVNDILRSWPKNGSPRRAGVSSFGIGGTNAHAVLEEWAHETHAEPDGHFVLPISARNQGALDAMTANLASHLRDKPQLRLEEAAFTLQAGRRHFDYRRAFVCSTLLELQAALAFPANVSRAAAQPSVAFVFPGQGSQHVGMAAGLYAYEPEFRKALDKCLELLKPHLDVDRMRSLLMRGEASASDLEATGSAQPALFAVEYSLAAMWMAWGVTPCALLGHSVGEYVAACLSGVFSLPDALFLVAARGRLVEMQPPGRMIAVALSEEEFRYRLRQDPWLCDVDLAVVNGPKQCVASGPASAIEMFARQLEDDGISATPLHTSHAFHSRMMEPAVEPLRAHVASVRRNAPVIPFVSNLTGEWIGNDEATDPAYWARHLRATVRFRDGARLLTELPNPVLIECGPGRTLNGLMRQQIAPDSNALLLSTLPQAPQEDRPAHVTALEAAARCWTAGVDLNWKRVSRDAKSRRVSLPGYPFERHRHWVEPEMPDYQQGQLPDLSPGSLEYRSPAWLSKPLTPSLERVTALARDWILFTDSMGIAERLARQLLAAGRRVMVAVPGENFAKIGGYTWQLKATESSDYDLLLDCLVRSTNRLSIVHLWNLTAPDATAIQSKALGFYSLIALARALGKRKMDARIDVFTTSMQKASSDDEVQPDKALIMGPCRVIPQEYPGITCRAIDVKLPAETALFMEELTEEARDDLFVARRGADRRVLFYQRSFLPMKGAAAWRHGGVYLITGGLSGIGLELAIYLGERFQAKIVLVGRSGASNAVARRLQGIEEAGGQVLLLRADVSDSDRMREVIEIVKKRHGSIHGVIHSAGIANWEPLEQTTMTGVEAVFAPKVTGVRVLQEALYDQPPDFIILFSSLSAIVGGVGNCAYTSANAFLDAVANSSAAAPKVVSINWSTWSEVGMAWAATQREGHRSLSREVLKNGIRTADGIHAIEEILCSGLRQVLVIPAAKVSEPALRESGVAALQNPIQASPSKAGAAHNQSAEAPLARIWQLLLGVHTVRPQDDFFKLGGHSLLALQMLSRVREAFGLDIPLHKVFEAPTLAGLSTTIERALVNRIAELSDEEVRLELTNKQTGGALYAMDR